jgi:hypothetical protein
MFVVHLCKLVSTIAVSVALGGCVTGLDIRSQEKIARQEVRNPTAFEPKTYRELISYADKLSDGYIYLSDKIMTEQDVVGTLIIASAGVAAGGLLYDASIDLVKGAGLAAGTLTAATTYFNPSEASSHLLDAAKQLACVSSAAASATETDENAGLVKEAIVTIRINLRKKLSRKLPDYGELVQKLKVSLLKDAISKSRGTSNLEVAINACVL